MVVKYTLPIIFNHERNGSMRLIGSKFVGKLFLGQFISAESYVAVCLQYQWVVYMLSVIINENYQKDFNSDIARIRLGPTKYLQANACDHDWRKRRILARTSLIAWNIEKHIANRAIEGKKCRIAERLPFLDRSLVHRLGSVNAAGKIEP